MLSSVFTEWAGMIFRWLHVVAAIGWIGSSFYFIHLDLSLKPTKDLPEGVTAMPGRCTAAASITFSNT